MFTKFFYTILIVIILFSGCSLPQKTATKEMFHLTEKPDIILWPETHYVFVEKVVPSREAIQAVWEEFHSQSAFVINSKRAPQMVGLYKIHPQIIYRAGVVVPGPTLSLPAEFKYEKFSGGKYAKFTVIGSYSYLPEASARIMKIVKQSKLSTRDSFYIEHYVNSLSEVTEDQLVTEILVPIN